MSRCINTSILFNMVTKAHAESICPIETNSGLRLSLPIRPQALLHRRQFHLPCKFRSLRDSSYTKIFVNYRTILELRHWKSSTSMVMPTITR